MHIGSSQISGLISQPHAKTSSIVVGAAVLAAVVVVTEVNSSWVDGLETMPTMIKPPTVNAINPTRVHTIILELSFGFNRTSFLLMIFDLLFNQIFYFSLINNYA